MRVNDELKEIERINNEINKLPKGNVTYKTIRGVRHMYLQWSENGKKHSKYIKAADERLISGLVAKRKMLESEHRRLLMEYGTTGLDYQSYGNIVREEPVQYGTNVGTTDSGFNTKVVMGQQLANLISQVEGFGRRECYQYLHDYLTKEYYAKVCILYGLRRTGKTVMLFQAIAELPVGETAYIKLRTSDDMDKLTDDLRKLTLMGVKYVFLDEVTLLSEFIESASLLSDIYAASGMKVVLSGTDSLGFMCSLDDELYDRACTIHTTYIPFREYSRLLGIHDVDEYIRYGGTFKVGETDFGNAGMKDSDSSFQDDESTRKYIDTAIARNIQHSLEHYQFGGHFRHLIGLYDKGELTSAINRIIEDMNHRFVLEILTKDFISHDLGSARQIARKKYALGGRVNPLAAVDKETVTNRLKEILDIKNRDEMSVELTDTHVTEIKQYLESLDLIVDIPSYTIETFDKKERIIFTQPGMRYCQAQALVYALMEDKGLRQYTSDERKDICDLILGDVKGRMLEDIVILETRKSLPRWKKVFKLEFEYGEFDMVIYDEKELTCEIFEIKHSSEIVEDQFRHLIDEDKCKKTEFQYGRIISKTVLYRGKDTVYKGINYKNIEGYLESLKIENM